MTLREIEETLHTLQSRHNDLDEGMLVTLLRSGGWEEKNIQEALLLFRSGSFGGKSLPAIQTESFLEPPVDGDHLLMDHNEEASLKGVGEILVPAQEPVASSINEKQSLVESVPERSTKKEDLPHNLPLRPFETSEHVWPFARYKDVFYGDTEILARTEVEREIGETAPKEKDSEPLPSVIVPPVTIGEMVVESATPSPVLVAEKTEGGVAVTKGDEKLVVIASVMLLVILLLLGYMYSNGRL